jgi:hypothetical protein
MSRFRQPSTFSAPDIDKINTHLVVSGDDSHGEQTYDDQVRPLIPLGYLLTPCAFT